VNLSEQNYLSSYSDGNGLRDNRNKIDLSGQATKMISVTTATNIAAKMILVTIAAAMILVTIETKITHLTQKLPSKTSYRRKDKRGRWKWQEDEEEDVRSYWMTLRTGEDTLI